MHIKSVLTISLAATCLLTTASIVFAQTNTLNWNSQGAVYEVQLVTPPEAIAQQQTFWGKVRLFLSIRKTTRIRPEIGTKLIVQASGYASSPYQTDSTPCITGSGTRVRPGVAATNFLPYGTKFEANGKKFIVTDSMNSRYAGYFMDLWFTSTSEALEFGRKDIEIVITGYGDPSEDVRATPTPTPQVAKEKKPGLWKSVKKQVSMIGDFLTTKVNPNVNRYDIDCTQP